MVCMFVMIFGRKYYEKFGMIHSTELPVSIEGCDFYVNTSTVLNQPMYDNNFLFLFEHVSIDCCCYRFNNTSTDDQPMFFFRLSFYYFTMFGTLVTMLVGLIISYATEKDEKEVDRSVISPVAHFLLPKEEKIFKNGVNYYSVDKALELVINDNGIDKK